MLLYWLLTTLFQQLLDALNTTINTHAEDFHFSSNPNLMAVVSYLLQANHFFPVDTWLAIAAFYFLIYGFMTTMKVIEILFNGVRGAGLRL